MRRSASIFGLLACAWLAGCTLIVDGEFKSTPKESEYSESGVSGDDEPDGSEPAGDSGSDSANVDSERPDAGRAIDAAAVEPDAASVDTLDAARDAGGSQPSDAGQSNPDAGQGSPDAGTPLVAEIQLCLGARHACAIGPSGKLRCWGSDNEDQLKLPSDRLYAKVACGDYHTCALDRSGGLVCAGRNRDGQRVTMAGPFSEVAAGDAHTCVLDTAGNARCFGLDSGGQASPPSAALRNLTAGTGISCGIRVSDSKVQCWGFSASNLTNVVSDTRFKSIDAGPSYVCGVMESGLLRCWANVESPDFGPILSASAGADGACAQLADRSVRCFAGLSTETMPFAGTVRSVVVGGDARCAVLDQGGISCFPDGSSVAPGPTMVE